MNYNVTIQMSQDTINYLRDNSYTLYGFKGVVSSNPKANPSIWFTLTPGTEEFGTVTNIQWSSPLYIGKCNLRTSSGGPIITTKSPWPGSPGDPVELGKAYTYDQNGWNTQSTDAPSDVFEIQNHMPGEISKYYVGSALVTTGTESPIIVVDALVDGGVTFSPIETVAFILAQTTYDAGTLIVQAFSGGSLLTFVGAADQATINYDLNGSWSSVNVPSPATFSKFASGTPLYQAMTNASQQALTVAVHQLEVLLSSHRQTLAKLELYSSLAEYNTGRCECDEHGVSQNKCKKGYKPKCSTDGKGEYFCDCVQNKVSAIADLVGCVNEM